MERDEIKVLFRSMRIPFLILTPVSVFLGFSTSYTATTEISFPDLFLVCIGALSAHISINTFNEYFDFESGLDAMTSRTPYSGGSGALIDNPEAAVKVLYLAIASLDITVLIGIYYIFTYGFLIFPLGIAGVLIIVTYTQWLNRYPFLCLLAPGAGFGPLMVVGTHVILTGEYSLFAFFVSLVPFFLASNMLLLNQYPDIAADKSVGRRHFPIAYGTGKSTILYGAFAMAACGIIVTGVFLEILPEAGYTGLLPMGFAFVAFSGAMKHAGSVKKLMPYLGMNVLATVLTPLVLGLSIIHG